jgi:hypothetical protein
MWIDCYQVFVNMDRVDYISFAYEDEQPTAYLYIIGRTEPVKLHSDDLEEMVKYFAKWTVGEITQ